MYQYIIVYILILLAIGGVIRFLYRKLKALKREEGEAVCRTCPLKKNCSKLKRTSPEKKNCCSGK